MNHKLKTLLAFILIAITTPLCAQVKQQVSGKERQADTYYLEQQYEKAIKDYKELLEKNYTNKQVYNRVSMKLASLYYETRRYADAEPVYEAIMPNVQAFTPAQAASFLTSLAQLGRSQRAEEVLDLFQTNPALANSRMVQNFNEGLQYIANEIPDTTGYVVARAPFNEEGSTFWTTRLNGGVLYVHIVDDEKAMVKGARLFYYDGNGSAPYGKLPQKMQQGPAAFANEGNTMIYTDNRYGKGIVRELKDEKFINNPLRLVELRYDSKNDEWESPKALFADKKDFSLCHPALSEDGNQLYFASNMDGSKGGMDIYMSRRTSKGWSTPANLGSVINTEGDELYPNIYKNQLTFCSNGLEGFGGFDVYTVQLGKDGFPVASTLKHLSYPVNTPYNDYALMYNDDHGGYFSSDRPDGKYLDAVYSWVDETYVNKLAQQQKALKDKKEQEKRDREQKAREQQEQALREQQEKAAAKQRPTSTVEAPSEKASTAAKGLIAGTLSADVTAYFDYDRSTLKRDGEKMLENFMIKLGGQRPNLMILGYADITGSSSYNLKLSRLRAQEVKNYLVSNGYPASAIEIVGRGQLNLSPAEEKDAYNLIDRLAPARKAEVKILE